MQLRRAEFWGPSGQEAARLGRLSFIEAPTMGKPSSLCSTSATDLLINPLVLITEAARIASGPFLSM